MPAMKPILKAISYLGLALSLVPGLLVFTGKIDLATSKNVLIAGMLLWFLTAIFWIERTSLEDDES